MLKDRQIDKFLAPKDRVGDPPGLVKLFVELAHLHFWKRPGREVDERGFISGRRFAGSLFPFPRRRIAEISLEDSGEWTSQWQEDICEYF